MPSQRLGRTLRLCLQDERKKTKPLLKEAGDKMKNPTPLIDLSKYLDAGVGGGRVWVKGGAH